jgi:uncharacterized protein with PIN domain
MVLDTSAIVAAIVDRAVYALAKSRSEPLLFKGGDFGKTDIAIAPV